MKDEKSPPFGTKSKKKKEPPHTQRGGGLFYYFTFSFFSPPPFPFIIVITGVVFTGKRRKDSERKRLFLENEGPSNYTCTHTGRLNC